MSNILLAACGGGGGSGDYEIEKSLRFRSSSLVSLSKVYPLNSDTSILIKTYSFWVKRGKLGAVQAIMSNGMSGAYNWFIGFTASDQLQIYSVKNNAVVLNKISTMVFRDPSAWYHIQISVDVSGTITEERVRLYVNGTRITSFSTNINPAINELYALCYLSALSGAYTALIGGYNYSSAWFEGYLSEINVIDGQALTPSYFGEWSQGSGQWVPIRYSGTYGNNGFYLDFKDNSALTNLGYDKSGLGNHWTPNNFSLTTGATYDSMLDTPSNNFCVASNLKIFVANYTVSNSGLTISDSSAANITTTVTMGIPLSGKYYWENTIASIPSTNAIMVGVGNITLFNSNVTTSFGSYRSNGAIYNLSGAQVATVAAYTASDVIGISVDTDTLQVKYYKNNVLQYTLSYSAGIQLVPYWSANNEVGTKTIHVNFGQRPFAYTPPTGFNKLCSKNLPTPAIKRGETGFDIATWTGNGGNLQVGEYQFPKFNYLIDRSLRFKGVNSFFNKTPASAGNRQKWTWAGWIKRGSIANALEGIFTAGISTAASEYFGINAANKLLFYAGDASSSLYLLTDKTIKDQAWHHIVLYYDSAQATLAERGKIFIDGIQASLDGPILTLNRSSSVNSTSRHSLGCTTTTTTYANYFEGYLAEVHFIDGQALNPSSFGEFDINGYWIPKAYTGTYGQNGFYLDFEDTSAVANLGFDKSGLGNNWAVNNLSLTAGITYDSMDDSPTQNFAVFDSLYKGSGATISNGGLSWTLSANPALALMSQGVRNGKYYLEVFNPSALASIAHCILTGDFNTISVSGGTSVASGMWEIYDNNVGIHYTIDGAAFVSPGLATRFLPSGTVQIAIDATEGKFWIGRNNVWYDSNWGTTGDPSTGVNPTWSISPSRGPFRYGVNAANAGTVHVNTGQRPFTYTPPEGFKTLSIPNIAEYTQDLESPDLVWIKCRNAAQNHMLFDSIRGAGKYLSSNLTAAEATDVNSLISFNKNGFYLGNNANVNTLNNTYVAWMWKASQTQLTNNAGTIESQVRANPDIGFSVVKYTGNGVESTIGHGLGIKPSMLIIKNTSSAQGWVVGHDDLYYSVGYWEANYHARLNDGLGLYAHDYVWSGDTTYEQFTSTTFQVGTSALTNGNGNNFIAYCFAEIEGFSKFGKYTGNGSTDGPFVYCGGSPRFIMIKRAEYSASSDWFIWDIERDGNNVTEGYVLANTTGVETGTVHLDILSNGFKLRSASIANVNAGVYIFAAFMDNPFKYSVAN